MDEQNCESKAIPTSMKYNMTTETFYSIETWLSRSRKARKGSARWFGFLLRMITWWNAGPPWAGRPRFRATEVFEYQ